MYFDFQKCGSVYLFTGWEQVVKLVIYRRMHLDWLQSTEYLDRQAAASPIPSEDLKSENASIKLYYP
jgi:hypothetical protein